MMLASFDLEQVIYLPKLLRKELYYSRQLSLYNFTVYDIKDGESWCYIWHEGIAKRGSNEIASCVHDFLQKVDEKGYEKVYFFCDCCSGQNRNSIIPAMLMAFISETENIREINISFFEPHHGQNEGDSVHSCVERALKRHREFSMPSEVVGIIKECRKTKPNKVIEMLTEDFLDWKTFSQQIGMLRHRDSDTGVSIDWTDLRAIRIQKEAPLKLGFKMKHSEDFSIINYAQSKTVRARARASATPGLGHFDIEKPTCAYINPPKLSAAKYKDLMNLVNGECPLVRNPDHQRFYRNLPHM